MALLPRAMQPAFAAAPGRLGRVRALLDLRGEELSAAVVGEVDRLLDDIRTLVPVFQPDWMEM